MNKRMVKYHPLTLAVLALGCGFVVPTQAQENRQAEPDVSIAQDNHTTIASSTTHTSSHESYAGQAFFERYYVKYDGQNVTTSAPSTSSVPSIKRSQFCRGHWVAPITQGTTTAKDIQQATTFLQADYAYHHPTQGSELSGDVILEQQGRQIRADKIFLDPTYTYATVQGRVEMAQDGIVAQSDEVHYNLREQTGNFNNSFYVSEQHQAHGRAGKIQRPDAQRVILHDASYSTCEPSASSAWKIQAKTIELNQETGRGISRGTKLYIKNTPVLNVPYFNFPIDDRRTTGLLNPTFGYINDGGVQLSMPIYLNLAPEYDATITPRYLSERGIMLDGEFRYMTQDYGRGKLWGGYLPSDNKYNNDDRKDLHFQHEWKINPQFSTRAEYHYASDKDFFTDLNQNPNTYTDLNLRRAWELNYAHGIEGLTANLKVESFQTLDETVADQDKPYARLPQFSMEYVKNYLQDVQLRVYNNTTYFKKRITDGSSVEDSGTRLYNDVSLAYQYRKPYGFFIPEIGVRTINTWFDDHTLSARGLSKEQGSTSVVVPQVQLSAGLNFEKQGKYLQYLSPQLFYAYAPYKAQKNNPNFDTTTASINYDQLFNSTRFYGYDRLDDNNFLSLGLNYRLFDKLGLEKLRVGLGQSFFFQDRQVTLSPNIDTERRTGPILTLGSQLYDNLSLTANSAWTSSGHNAQRDVQLHYTGDMGSLYNLGYFYRKDIENRQLGYEQGMLSFIHPIKDQWRLIGHAQYDFHHDIFRDALLGVNYESCCWGISVYGRSYYNDLDNVADLNLRANRAVMAEFTLKGLGGLNNKLGSLLESRVLGFNKNNQFWAERE